jgi:cytochrome d ubiquinol oxidase subunit I
MLALVLLSAFAWRRGWLFDPQRKAGRWLLRGWQTMTLSGFVAILAGWYVTEIGRQPYTVYGLLRTAESNSAISGAAVAFSLAVFVVVYVCVFGAGIWYLYKLVRKGPQPYEPAPDTDDGEKTPARPLSLPDEALEDASTEAAVMQSPTTGGAA